jgi:hypothetical protein
MLMLVGLLGSLLTAGCSSSSNQGPPWNAGQAALAKVVDAYVNAQQRLNRPPRGVEDLRSHLAGNPDEALRSPVDGEPYVIVWGTDVRTPTISGDTLPIFIYERKGKDGRRHAADVMLGMPVLSEQEFRTAQFAGGHRPGP